MTLALTTSLPSPYETPSELTLLEAEERPRNKGGRPKGSKNKPKWLVRLLKAQKKPRGRPPGAKNKPKTLGGFVMEAFANADMVPPPIPPKNPNKSRKPFCHRPPEIRRQLATKISHARKKGNRYGKSDVPKGWTKKTFAPYREAAKAEAKRIIKQMEKDGLLPEDQMAREALQGALQMMREPGPKELKLKALRTVLEYTKAKPATKSDVTIRTAEDYLDELAATEDNERNT